MLLISFLINTGMFILGTAFGHALKKSAEAQTTSGLSKLLRLNVLPTLEDLHDFSSAHEDRLNELLKDLESSRQKLEASLSRTTLQAASDVQYNLQASYNIEQADFRNKVSALANQLKQELTSAVETSSAQTQQKLSGTLKRAFKAFSYRVHFLTGRFDQAVKALTKLRGCEGVGSLSEKLRESIDGAIAQLQQRQLAPVNSTSDGNDDDDINENYDPFFD